MDLFERMGRQSGVVATWHLWRKKGPIDFCIRRRCFSNCLSPSIRHHQRFHKQYLGAFTCPFSGSFEECSFCGLEEDRGRSRQAAVGKGGWKIRVWTFFPSIYRHYVRALLHLPIATDKRITQTVDFRDADPKALEPLSAHFRPTVPTMSFMQWLNFASGWWFPKTESFWRFHTSLLDQQARFFHQRIAERYRCGSKHPFGETRYRWTELVRCLSKSRYKRQLLLNLATLSHMDRFHCSNYIQENILLPRGSLPVISAGEWGGHTHLPTFYYLL